MERFLDLSAEDNQRVVYPSTSAQYFHVLRRQVLATRRVPLICFTPKRYLRMPQTRSNVSEFTSGGFRLTLDDRAELDRDAVRRVLLCTGKIGHELMDERDELGAPAAVVRVEQLYPWPEDEILTTVAEYPNAREVWWVQEEPANMGGWNFTHARLARALRDRAELRHVAREASASPATGSQTIHEREQQQLLAAAFEGLGEPSEVGS
jgi:2-oxoglutarate dehydrogenase E1 component